MIASSGQDCDHHREGKGLPFVRLLWSNGHKSLEPTHDLGATRIPVERNGRVHHFRLSDQQDDPEGFSIYEEEPANDG